MAVDTYKSPVDGYLQDTSLPEEVLAVLPTDTYACLELAYRITCHAYSQQVSRLEREGQEMASTLEQHQQLIKSLERRVAGMEADMHEHQQRARHSLAEQHKLVAEKNALIETVKRLNREVAKLEHFKRNLLQQLQDEEEVDGAASFAPTMAAVDLTTERLVSEVLQSADGIAAAAAVNQHHTQHQQQQQQRYPSSQQGSRLSPIKTGSAQAGALTAGPGPNRRQGSPNDPGSYAGSQFPVKAATASAPASPYRQRPVQTSPQRGSATAAGAMGAAAAAGADVSGRGLAAGRFGAAAVSRGAGGVGPGAAAAGRAAAGGTTGGGSAPSGSGGGAAMSSPRIDGKEFFRQARARLSYEQFSQFLVAIKELNAGRASREDTLGAAHTLFGPANSDLYGLFEGLLTRHLTSL